MAKFKVFVSWAMQHVVLVEAKSVGEAIAIVENDGVDINPEKCGRYVDDSFQVDTHITLEQAAQLAEKEENHG